MDCFFLTILFYFCTNWIIRIMACDNEVVKVPPIFICHVTKLKYNYLHERANFHLQNKGILKRGEINS